MRARCPNCNFETTADGETVACPACGQLYEAEEAPPPGAAEPPDPFIGKVIGGCRLLEPIGAGGMGIVYKAEQLSLGRTVAVKLLQQSLQNDPQIHDRFRREIRVLAKLSHPNIINILDGGADASGVYFIMEYVGGVSLRRVLNAGGLRPVEALQIVRQLCDALEYAHGEGVVHRDVKPENIIIDKDGRVRLLDFGLSRILNINSQEMPTKPTQIIGTYDYMAPEQREARPAADHRADLYSLGVVIYEMLTGELPIGRFEPPSRKNVHIDVRLDDVVLRALDKSPERRYQSAGDLKTEVQRIAAAPPTPSPRPPQATKTEPPVAAAVVPPSHSPPNPPPPVFAPPRPHAPPPRPAVTQFANVALAFALITMIAMIPCAAAVFDARADREWRAAALASIAVAGFASMLTIAAAFAAFLRIHFARGALAGAGRAAAAFILGIGSPLLFASVAAFFAAGLY